MLFLGLFFLGNLQICPRLQIMSVTPFQTEAWTEYGLGTVVLLLRYFARWKTVGFKNWQGDDLFAVLALVFWTVSLRFLARN